MAAGSTTAASPRQETSRESGRSSSKKAKDFRSLSGKQKAAIFLVSLGSEISSEIFKHLREDEIETLTFEIARLDVFHS